MLGMTECIKFFVVLAIFATGTSARRIRATSAGRAILLEVEDVLGKELRQSLDHRSYHLEDVLRHTFQSLPRNNRGAVGAPAARYALHRLFVQLHGWQMKGLELQGDDWHHASPIAAMSGHIPDRLHTFLEERLSTHGLDLHELSVLGALFEHMVHINNVDRLNITLQALGIQEDTIDRKYAFDVMHAYLATYVVGKEEAGDSTAMKKSNVLEHVKLVERGLYPRWTAAKNLVSKAADDLVPGAASFTTETILTVLESVGDQIFHLENEECSLMRNRLVDLEDQAGSGRVPLGKFYRSNLDNPFMNSFTESETYLEKAGALLDTNGQKRVIIPNYLLLNSNCLATAGYYAVCCIDECEDLMDHVESSIRAPTATPTELFEVVSNWGLSHNQSLTAQLKELLEDVAGRHGGEVALHGRLFAQWLHHVYPRTCPYPHEVGIAEDDDMHPLEVSREEMMRQSAKHEFEENLSTKRSHQNIDFVLWSDNEALVDPEAHKVRHQPSKHFSTAVMILGTVIGCVVTLKKMTPELGVHRKLD